MNFDPKNPNFDLAYQEGILHMCLTDTTFAKGFVMHVKEPGKKPSSNVFTGHHHNILFGCIANSIEEFNCPPSKGHVANYLKQEMGESESRLVMALYNKVMNMELLDKEYYRASSEAYIKVILKADLREYFEENFEDTEAVIEKTRVFYAKCDSIELESSSFQTLDDVFDFVEEDDELTEEELKQKEKVKTLIPDLDRDLSGGLPKGQLVIVLGSNNIGKSTFTIDVFGKSALLQGKRVLHIPLDSDKEETLIKYVACLGDVPTDHLFNKTLSDAEKEVVKKTVEQFKGLLLIKNMVDYENKAEKLISQLEAIKKVFDFDVLLIDYIACLDTYKPTSSIREKDKHIHRLFRTFAVKNDVLVVSPAQANREGQVKNFGNESGRDKAGNSVLRSTNIAESDDIGRVAGTIFTINRTDEEMTQERVRVLLEKQRRGKKNILYGLYTNYGHAQINTGKYFDPNSIVEAEELIEGDTQKEKYLAAADAQKLRKSIFKKISERQTALENYRLNTEKALAETNPAKKQNFDDYAKTSMSRANDLQRKIAEEARLIFPTATREVYEKMKESTTDMKKHNPDAKLQISQAEGDLSIMSYLFRT